MSIIIKCYINKIELSVCVKIRFSKRTDLLKLKLNSAEQEK